MVKRDSLGVPLEPEEPRLALVDEYHREIYQGDQYWIDGQGNPYANGSLYQYADDYVQSLTLAEAWEELNNLLKTGETEELLKDTLYESIIANGVITTFDMEEAEA
ncbi:hypothetical protein [Enterococcus diestrammenae]|uniref:Uncharacterized protein n=1 Tax=Enterococcus diestrammenae TaxID=1155073 RepID=A0ABV0F8L4_9ENTE|nr:hypothetical protein [Enterococcus diestrammenae]KAF1300030.1 hypothetical protein BAU18_13000 [Enterococcus diestrammenae]